MGGSVSGDGGAAARLIAVFGAWRSLVARTVRVGEVPGSNPGAPIDAAGLRNVGAAPRTTRTHPPRRAGSNPGAPFAASEVVAEPDLVRILAQAEPACR